MMNTNDSDDPQTASKVLSVTEINRMARLAIEKSLPSCWIRGEISNLTRAASGHWYFSLKDASASARCVMFRQRNQFLDWVPREGDSVEIRAQASLYEARGEFQLSVDAMRRSGAGSLFDAFLKLKAKLLAEGLFDPARKQPLPARAQRIGIITSAQAAALRDVLITLRRRWPLASIVLYPTLVQGDAAPAQIVRAIEVANVRLECEVLLLVRGGGSLEDLWAFNDERVARAIAASHLPIVSGVGHETDFSIADFVADARAPTPTAAAQMISPDQAQLRLDIGHYRQRLTRGMTSFTANAWQRHDHLLRRVQHPRDRLANQRQHLKQLADRLARVCQYNLATQQNRLHHQRVNLRNQRPDIHSLQDTLVQDLQRMRQTMRHSLQLQWQRLRNAHTNLGLLCPEHVLKRGYSIVRNHRGEIIVSSTQVSRHDAINITLAHGRIEAEVSK